MVLDFIGLLVVAPLGLPIRMLGCFDKRELCFQFGSHFISLFPGIPGDYLRRAYYRWVMNVGTVSIGFGTILAQRDTDIESGVYIGSHCNIGSSHIERDVLIGSKVMIASPSMHHFDRLDIPIRDQGGRTDKSRIGEGTWVGNGAIILSDIGRGVVIAAGAVVTKPCEDFGIFGGNPARLIRSRLQSSVEEHQT